MKQRFIFFVMCLMMSPQASAWWAWTPGGHVENSTQSSVVGGYRPDQPIPFSHKLHAGTKANGGREIHCEYCHNSARRSRSAGIAPENTCMGCHKMVNTDAESIKYIKQKYDANEPIPWMKVHDLPDYVRFTHQPHVLAKDKDGQPLLKCQTCHGPVETMTVAEQWAPMQMGWCIECHNRVKVPAQPAVFENGKKVKEAVPEVRNAPVTCNTCHF